MKRNFSFPSKSTSFRLCIFQLFSGFTWTCFNVSLLFNLEYSELFVISNHSCWRLDFFALYLFFLSKVAAAYCVWTVLESCLLWVCPTCHRLWTWSVRFLWKITGRSGAVRLRACVRACVDACRCIIERATSYSTAGQAWRLEPLWPCVFTSEIEHPCNTMMDYKIDLVLGTHLRVGVNACACGQFFL